MKNYKDENFTLFPLPIKFHSFASLLILLVRLPSLKTALHMEVFFWIFFLGFQHAKRNRIASLTNNPKPDLLQHLLSMKLGSLEERLAVHARKL